MDSDYYVEELKDTIQDLTNAILELRKMRGDDKIKRIEEIEKNLKQAKKNYNRLNNETRVVDEAKKKQLEDQKRFFKNEIAKLSQSLEQARQQAKEQLFEDAAPPPSPTPPADEKKKKKKSLSITQFFSESVNFFSESDEVKVITKGGGGSKKKGNIDDPAEEEEEEGKEEEKKEKKKKKKKVKDEKMEQELFAEIFGNQDESMAIIQRMLAKAEESKKIALEANEILAKQKEQLQQCDAELDKIGDNAKQAKAELNKFMKRVGKTKFLLVLVIIFLVLALLVIAGVVVFMVLKTLGLIPECFVNCGGGGGPTPQRS